MKLTSKTLILSRPRGLQAPGLHSWVKGQLRVHGEPLRWAITAVEHSLQDQVAAVHVEVVLIE